MQVVAVVLLDCGMAWLAERAGLDLVPFEESKNRRIWSAGDADTVLPPTWVIRAR